MSKVAMLKTIKHWCEKAKTIWINGETNYVHKMGYSIVKILVVPTDRSKDKCGSSKNSSKITFVYKWIDSEVYSKIN